MGDGGEGDFDPTEHEVREVAGEAAYDREEFLALLPHYYRGEVSNMGTLVDRLDLTVDWSIAVVTAVLALAFESVQASSYLLLIGMVAVTMFLLFDVRRYRTYDAVRARVRLVEENVYANVFAPEGAPLPEWREEIGDDLREPTFKVSYAEALSRRLRRVYFLLYSLLVVAWLFRISVFVPNESWLVTASVPGVSGEIIVAAVAIFYGTVVVLTFRPREREAKGEFHGQEPGSWKR